MTNFYNMFINFMLIGLVVFGIFSFSIMFQENNGVSDPIIEDTVINETFGDLESDLESFRGTAQTQKELFETENPTGGFGTILLFSIVSTGKIFNSMIITLFNTIIKLPVVFFGLDIAVVSILSVILIISIIIGLWIVYKLGG